MKQIIMFLLLALTLVSAQSAPAKSISTYNDSREQVWVDATLTGPQLLGQVAGGVGGSVVTSYVLAQVFMTGCDGWGCLGGFLIGVSVGIPTGATLGVYFTGKVQGKQSSFAGTLLGTVLSTTAAIGFLVATDDVEMHGAVRTTIPAVILLSGPIAGFNLFAEEQVKVGDVSLMIDRYGELGVKADLINLTF